MFRHIHTLVAVPCLLLALTAGCASDRAVISQANAFHGELKPAVISDPQLNAYLQQVGQRIIDVAREMYLQKYGPAAKSSEDSAWMFQNTMQFHFVNSDTLNAFTTGGEHMYIYTGLFQQCRSEDELAAVMAHEYAHVYGRHVHKGINRQMAVIGAAAAAGAAGYVAGGEDKGSEYAAGAAGLAMAVGQFVGMQYTRSDEAEADDMGFDFYVRAGWDPARFGDFFQQLIDKGYDKGPEFLSDHPSLKNRVQAARAKASQLPPAAAAWRKPPVAAGPAFTALQQRSVVIGKTMPTDASLQHSQTLLAAMSRSCLTPAIHPDQKKARAALAREAEQQRAAATRPATSRQRRHR